MLDVLKDVWTLPPATSTPDGPPPFPRELARRLIEMYTAEADLVVDPFGGTGTVGAVAKLMNRRIWMVERQRAYWPRLIEIVAQQTLPSAAVGAERRIRPPRVRITQHSLPFERAA